MLRTNPALPYAGKEPALHVVAPLARCHQRRLTCFDPVGLSKFPLRSTQCASQREMVAPRQLDRLEDLRADTRTFPRLR